MASPRLQPCLTRGVGAAMCVTCSADAFSILASVDVNGSVLRPVPFIGERPSV